MSPALALAVTGAAAFLTWPLTRFFGRAAGWPLALLYIVGAASLPFLAPALESPSIVQIPWVSARNWNLDFAFDPTGNLFAMLALAIGAVVLIYSAAYLKRENDDGTRIQHYGFYQLMTLFTLSMLGLVLTDSLIVLFVCWELTSLASFALIANSGRPAFASAMRTLLVTFFGGLVLLAAIVAIIVRTGSTSISEALFNQVWTTDPTFTSLIAVAIAVAAMTKSAQWPFHFWLPDAMAAATPVSAYLHAAAVVKAGIFLLIRFSPAFHNVPVWNVLLIAVGMGTAIMAGLFALQKTDLKQLMAYSTVSQLGWIVAAIGVGTPMALAAAAIHTIAHALFKSGLFMLVGVVDHQAGTRDIRRLGPLWRRMPYSFTATVLGAAAMAGIPPTLGFVSKESILVAFGEVSERSPWIVVLLLAAAVVGAILTVTYCARIVFGAFIDGPRDVSKVREAPVRLWLPAALPAAIGLPLAFVVWILDKPVGSIASAATNRIFYTASYEPFTSASVSDGVHSVDVQHLSTDLSFEPGLALWHGFSLELGLTALILASATVLIVKRHRVSAFLEGRQLFPVTGADLLEKSVRAVVRVGRSLVMPTASDSPSRHAAALLATVSGFGLLTGAWAVASGTAFPQRLGGLDQPVDLVLFIVIAVSVLGLCVAPSRIAAVVLLSAVGIAVTIQLFGLGAPDVGMTQLLVEALTIIVFMLVLRRLPGTFIAPSRRRRRGAIALAAVTGLAATTAVLVFTARRERSGVGLYLLDNAEELTGGNNVVNTVLVEFRALDTFGEVAVLGMAGIAILAVLGSVRRSRRDPADEATIAVPLWTRTCNSAGAAALEDQTLNTAPLRLLARGVTPVLLLVSVLLFWRGHNEPGGGFIAALVASCAIALHYLSRPDDAPVSRPSLPVSLIGGGLLVAGITGIVGYTVGAFLEPVHGYLFGTHLTSALIFDLGVFAGVIGLVLTAFNILGTGKLRSFIDGAGANKVAKK